MPKIRNWIVLNLYDFVGIYNDFYRIRFNKIPIEGKSGSN